MSKFWYVSVGLAAVAAIFIGAWRVYAGDLEFSDEIEVRLSGPHRIELDEPLTIYTPGGMVDEVMPLLVTSTIVYEDDFVDFLSADFSTGGTLESPGGVPQIVNPNEVAGGFLISENIRAADHFAVMDLSLLDYTEQDLGGGVTGLVSDDMVRVIGVAESYDNPGETTSDVAEAMLDITVLDAALVDGDGNGIPDATALLEPFTVMMGPNGNVTYVVDLGRLTRGGAPFNGNVQFGLQTEDGPLAGFVDAPTMNQLAAANAAYEMYAGRLIVTIASDLRDLVDLPDNADPAGEFDLGTDEPDGIFIRTLIALTDAVDARGSIPQWTFLDTFPDDDLEVFVEIGGPGLANQIAEGDVGFGYLYDTQTTQSGEDILIESGSGWGDVPFFAILDPYEGDNEERGGVTVDEGDDSLQFRSLSASGIYASNLMPAISSDGGGGGGGSHCFIATAAYGTPMATEIQSLRDVRDAYLIDTALGAAFVDAYYRVSPPIARMVSEYPAAKTAVRAVLSPVVAVSAWTLEPRGLGAGMALGIVMFNLVAALRATRLLRMRAEKKRQ